MIKSIARKELKVMLKEKGLFFWMFVLPILFIVLFASIFGGTANTKITVHYIDEDKSDGSRKFLESISALQGFALKQDEQAGAAEQIEKIRNGKLSSLLVIPQGFGETLHAGTKTAELMFYQDATADAAAAPIQAVMENIAAGYREGKLAGGLAEAGVDAAKINQILLPPIQINQSKESAVKVDMIAQVVPGYTVMFVFFIMITMVTRFIKEKESGSTARLRSTSMHPLHYLIGMWIPHIIVVLVQSAVLLTFGHFVYGLHLGDLSAILVLVVSLALCGTSFGLALSLLVNSENQGVAFTQIIAMGGAVLGGLWFPIELMPDIVQQIGRFLPQFWAQKGLQDVMIRGANIGGVWPSIVILLAFASAGLLVAWLRFKRFMQTAVN
ncbi:ABC transporter permease [Paenibacillus sp. GCM10027626]|uniref:ABC transporter permease n=1 Tax=Paenibacillus sp. GCM10027626 TaxID=3273411 RepID=UPI00363BA618